MPAYVLANEFVVMVTQTCIHTDNSHLLYQLAMSLVNKIGTESQLEAALTQTSEKKKNIHLFFFKKKFTPFFFQTLFSVDKPVVYVTVNDYMPDFADEGCHKQTVPSYMLLS